MAIEPPGLQYPTHNGDADAQQRTNRMFTDNLFYLRGKVGEQSSSGTPSQSVVAANESPTGNNKVFTFSAPPIAVFVNGLLQRPNIDYTQNDISITFSYVIKKTQNVYAIVSL